MAPLNTQAPAPPALTAIQTAAASRGLNWRPLAAVAHFESGLDPSSIGDGGHAFGLFQNNNAGGTITGDPNPRRFLNPNVSANYTADAIKRLGIQGLSPSAQVAAIVNRYERPANPGREIAGAQSYLATLGQGAASPAGGSPAMPTAPAPSLPTLNLAPLQASLQLGQQQTQRAQDALGSISGQDVRATAAPNLAKLIAAAPSHPTQTVSVNPAHPTPTHIDPQAQKVVELAKHYLGTKYVFGGETPKTGFDCSGLAQWSYGQLGIQIPRTAAEQYQAAKKIGANQLKPGDLVFFSNTDGPGVTHVGIYAGGPNRSFIQAPHTGDVVKVSSLNDPYYQQHFTSGGSFQ